MKIRKAITALVLASSLAGCGAADVISNGFFYSRTVATDLENATGLRPQVTFEWHNGSFQSVTVTFPHVYVGKPLHELVSTVREVVVRDFKQTPDTIVLAFSLDK
jgi:ABC-type glycerol-3-phosphate transport system substrate-binding protein